VGALVLGGTGWSGGAVLGVFFVSSSIVSRVAGAPAGSDAKGNRRDHWQVIANGAPAALSALLGIEHPLLGLWAVAGSLAAAAADTWATALGAWSPTAPRLLLGGRRVEPGASGGVTWLGSLGGAAGAFLVSATGALGGGGGRLLAVGTLIGFAGMLVDSILGSMWQGRFFCPGCAEPSEWRIHRCGAPTVWRGGVAWLNNDVVNLAATALGAGMAAAAWALWAR
jgi:uncharacterized protein (TIGR00297 family)